MDVAIYVICCTSIMILIHGNPLQDQPHSNDKLLTQLSYISNPNVTINIIFNSPNSNNTDRKVKSNLIDLKDEVKFKPQQNILTSRRKFHILEKFLNNLIKKTSTTMKKHCDMFDDENIEGRSKSFRGKYAIKNQTTSLKEDHHLRRANIDDTMCKDFGNIPEESDSLKEKRNREKVIYSTRMKLNHKSQRSLSDLSLEEADLAQNRIVGGDKVEIANYPYHAAYGDHCGAAIISSKWLITAAHCGEKPSARVGSKYYKVGKQIHVKNRYIHPIWRAVRSKEHTFDYDFQLVELEDELEFNKNVQPIKIGHSKDYVVGQNISVTGWGSTQEDGPYSSILREVNLPLVEESECQNIDFPYFRNTLTKRMFCAGYKDAKYDACQGDSGGPAVMNHKLLGMVSFGYGCATPNSLGVYSKVSEVRDWISSITGIET